MPPFSKLVEFAVSVVTPVSSADGFESSILLEPVVWNLLFELKDLKVLMDFCNRGLKVARDAAVIPNPGSIALHTANPDTS